MDDGLVRSHRRAAELGIDAIAFTAVVASALWKVVLTRHGWFYIDDWKLAQQSESIGGIFSAYNGHLSVVILVLYRMTLEVFGFSTYLPFRVLGAVCFASVGAALYFALHRHVGRPIAFLVGAVMLWPAGATVEVCALNHWLSVTGGVVCAVLLRRRETRRTNVLLAGMLAFSLASADGGVAVGVACIVFAVWIPVSWKRRLAVVGPVVGWAVWWYFMGRSATTKFPQQLGMWRLVQLVVYGIGDSAKLLTFGMTINGWIVLAALTVLAVIKVRRGRVEMANVLAWTAALIFWWAGIAWFRAGGFTIYIFRYQYVGAVFLILACVPVKPVRWDRVRSGLEGRRSAWNVPAAVLAAWLVVLVASGFSVVHRGAPAVRASANDLNTLGDRTLATARIVARDASTIPDDRNLGVNYYFMSAGEVRALFRAYDSGPR